MSFDGCDWVSYEIEQYQPVHSKVYELIKITPCSVIVITMHL